MSQYPFQEIEHRWQNYWANNSTYRVHDDFTKPKYYILDMFPYPSGAGLHIGHPEGYTATDIIARYKKMKGFNVLHPMGFDAFGLPTEQYSMKHGIHPYIATMNNVDNFKRQLNMLGFGYDWHREINTTDPAYYKWTQWMFLIIYNSWFDEALQKARPIEELPIPHDISSPADIEIYRDEHRLAFIDSIPVNWCEELGTVLANEEVDEWKEKGFTVERKPMRQWMLRITKYAQRLLDDLETVEWVTSTKEMQKNWIGKSQGAEIYFPVLGEEEKITVFTTRPDTLFGATYVVLAPEHPLVSLVTTDDNKHRIADYREKAAIKSDLERTELAKEKTGCFTGSYALNPATGKEVPIWIADYVLGHYGTGAVMAVPAHDDRDHEFAQQYNLPIVQVVAHVGHEISDENPIDLSKAAFTDDGVNIESENDEVSLNHLLTSQAKTKIIEWLENSGNGKGTIQYRLRDWLFSRQRYWGEPIPIIFFEDGTKRAMDYDELPLLLPELQEFKPSGTGESPLATVESWVQYYDKKTGKTGKIETNTMPQWAGSCWYYLRYIDPKNINRFCDEEKEKYWMGETGVDLYVGGTEHAVLHLLYARFWHKVLFDYGYVSTNEPFKKLFHQGMILAEDNRKMSKSLGNVVNPDDIVAQFGADALRVFEMFMGPLEAAKPWASKGVEGVFRFLNRVWRLFVDENGTLLSNVQDVPLTKEQEYVLHYTIKKISEDIENLSMNTAVAQMMIFVNEFTKADIRPLSALRDFIKILYPFAPHIAEELWHKLGNTDSLWFEEFPIYDESKLQKSEVEIIVQINSKIKAKCFIAVNATSDEMEASALALPDIAQLVEGKSIKKKIVVPGKLVNFIIG
ncbi:MAG: leucine--tRNA ligase [Ignavibacteria bacterium]|nr:leucine--tRNA ligase [Ignavibacteria bacterium]